MILLQLQLTILPVISDGFARKVDSNFIINATVDDLNLDDGDSVTVHAIIEHSSAPYVMNFDADSNYTLTVAEAAIIDERGGLRTVTFEVADSYGELVQKILVLLLKLTKQVHLLYLQHQT